MNLYCTADQIGTPTGGGAVTYHESEALKSLGPCEVYGRREIEHGLASHDEPWCWDESASSVYKADGSFSGVGDIRLAHFYAGTWSRTIKFLKQKGTKVTYTAAAHDVNTSRREHEQLGLHYDYPHLTEPDLLRRYLAGYLAADVLICPSQHSAGVMRVFGYTGRIEIIPHGVNLPERASPTPARFTVGYLGAYGPDKGVRYLLEAWKRLNYKEATLLLGGRDSTSPWVQHLIQKFGGGNIHCCGWVDDVSTFYNQCSLYVQPSVTEGFGIEVLEALAHGRPVVCSRGAGACDVVVDFDGGVRHCECAAPGSVDELVECINYQWYVPCTPSVQLEIRAGAEQYTWDRVRARYQDLWRSLL